MTSINGNYSYNNSYYAPQNNNNEETRNYYYKRKNPALAEVGWLAASLATGLIYKLLPSFSNPFLKQMTKEHSKNHIYSDVFQKAYENSKLKEKGLRIVHDTNPLSDVGKGLNAYFSPSKKEIVLNRKLASISGFHELGHAMNYMNGGFGRFLQKLRGPGYALAGFMGTVALFSRDKAKGEKRNLKDIIVDNAHVIAFASMLPTVLEEGLASVKGIKAAKKAGLDSVHLKNLKKFYGKALLSYGGYAFVTGLSVFAAGKIMDKFTRPQKIEY